MVLAAASTARSFMRLALHSMLHALLLAARHHKRAFRVHFERNCTCKLACAGMMLLKVLLLVSFDSFAACPQKLLTSFVIHLCKLRKAGRNGIDAIEREAGHQTTTNSSVQRMAAYSSS